MNEIFWPEHYAPGMTDNFVSNEVIVAGLTAAAVWPWLTHPRKWPLYYGNASDVRLYEEGNSELHYGSRFLFTTFDLSVEGEVTELVAPAAGTAARVAWHGWVEGDSEHRLDVHHAWLIEDLPGTRVRILTQESQIGSPALKLAVTRPNPMLNAHQEWLEGLVAQARRAVQA